MVGEARWREPRCETSSKQRPAECRLLWCVLRSNQAVYRRRECADWAGFMSTLSPYYIYSLGKFHRAFVAVGRKKNLNSSHHERPLLSILSWQNVRNDWWWQVLYQVISGQRRVCCTLIRSVMVVWVCIYFSYFYLSNIRLSLSMGNMQYCYQQLQCSQFSGYNRQWVREHGMAAVLRVST